MTTPLRVPKILGADVELGNFIEGIDTSSGSGPAASRLLLREIDGVSTSASEATSAQDWGRKFLEGNGGCAYVDLDHLELALPETFSAFDHVAYWRAMLDIARAAEARANQRMPAGYRIRALANCSDGLGHAYGAHVSLLLTRTAWDNIVTRKPHYLAYLGAFQASSIVFTGAGKVGSENRRPPAHYQLSQRADFIETTLGEQTTYRRPLVNGRDEPLCGASGLRANHAPDSPSLSRLHVIFFDATLCQVATLLRVGTLQIVAAMIEAECVSPKLALDDAIDALQAWSHDPSLSARAPLVAGGDVTAVELQQMFLDEARRFEASHGFAGIVPRAAEILDLWEDTLRKLAQRDFAPLARRLDWVLKRQILERAMSSRSSLAWTSPEVKHLDQLYASIDEREGLFWAYEQAGLVDTVVSDEAIRRAIQEPPADTRAWTRAYLLRKAGTRCVDDVDWDRIDVRTSGADRMFPWTGRWTVRLPYPFGATRADNQDLFAGDRSLEHIVTALKAEDRSTLGASLASKYGMY
jgi:hypothetical protein